jgi:hypothetical protein
VGLILIKSGTLLHIFRAEGVWIDFGRPIKAEWHRLDLIISEAVWNRGHTIKTLRLWFKITEPDLNRTIWNQGSRSDPQFYVAVWIPIHWISNRWPEKCPRHPIIVTVQTGSNGSPLSSPLTTGVRRRPKFLTGEHTGSRTRASQAESSTSTQNIWQRKWHEGFITDGLVGESSSHDEGRIRGGVWAPASNLRDDDPRSCLEIPHANTRERGEALALPIGPKTRTHVTNNDGGIPRLDFTRFPPTLALMISDSSSAWWRTTSMHWEARWNDRPGRENDGGSSTTRRPRELVARKGKVLTSRGHMTERAIARQRERLTGRALQSARALPHPPPPGLGRAERKAQRAEIADSSPPSSYFLFLFFSSIFSISNLGSNFKPKHVSTSYFKSQVPLSIKILMWI